MKAAHPPTGLCADRVLERLCPLPGTARAGAWAAGSDDAAVAGDFGCGAAGGEFRIRQGPGGRWPGRPEGCPGSVGGRTIGELHEEVEALKHFFTGEDPACRSPDSSRSTPRDRCLRARTINIWPITICLRNSTTGL